MKEHTQRTTQYTSIALKSHERIPIGDKPFNYSQCDYKCPDNGYLKVHEVIWRSTQESTQEINHSAALTVPKDSVSRLKAHERTHTTEKLFSNSQCEKKFAIEQTFKRHERTHTNDESLSKNHVSLKSALEYIKNY